MATVEEGLRNIEKVSEFIEAFDFEVYDIPGTLEFMRENRHILLIFLALYLIGIYYGQKLMEKRRAMKLRWALFSWNFSLAIFSILITLRMSPEIFYTLSGSNGLYNLACRVDHHNYATSYWGRLFLISKFIEFGDTAFIILRKQKLIFLHWFHHGATAIAFWIGYEAQAPFGRVLVLNAFVHSLMYTYYALKALKVKIPKKISRALTIIQISQLVTIIILAAILFNYVFVEKRPCIVDIKIFWYGFTIMGIFLVLFLDFFHKSYYSGNKKKSEDKTY